MNNQVDTICGIDLGTTYSCIAYVDEFGKAMVIPNSEGDRTTPSVVYFEGNNRVVGKEAKNNAVLNPEQVVEMVKRHMGEADWRFFYDGVEYTAEEISSYILRKLVDDAEQHLGYPVTDVVITCPAYFGIAQREATAQAGSIAGLRVWEILNEPTAAALMYGLHNEQDQTVLVYDLGGGTFDITVIEIKQGTTTVVATGGDHNLGGRDWDEAVVRYLAERWGEEAGNSDDPLDSSETLQDLWMKAEHAKLALTAKQETRVAVTHAGYRVGITLTRQKFNELTAHLLERTIAFTKATMEEARSRGHKRFDQILLVGGSTRMPQVAHRLEQEFGLPCRIFDPDEAAAKGAALYAQMLLVNKKTQTNVEPGNKDEVHVGKSRPNFFILLGLNPDELWDQVVLERVLQEKRREWSRQSSGIGTKALVARKNLELISEIRRVMEDPDRRSEELANAHTHLALERRTQRERFEKQLAFAEAKGYLEQAELASLISEFRGALTEEEILSKVKVEVHQPERERTIVTEALDPSVAKSIAERLTSINMLTLYEFLDRPETTSTEELARAAEQSYVDLVRRQPITAEVTAKMELAGFARQIFNSVEIRKRYDESLRRTSLDNLLRDLDDSVSRTVHKEVRVEQVAFFLEAARSVGWDEEIALAILKNHAQTRKWLLQIPSIDMNTQKVRCGNCHELNKAGQNFCRKCGSPLYIDCPDCGQKLSSDDTACGNCGFPIGNRFWVDTALERYKHLLQLKNIKGAQELLNEIKEAWKPKVPDTRAQKISQYMFDIQRILQEEQQATLRLQQLIDRRQMYAAQLFLAQLAPDLVSNHQFYKQRIDDDIAHADELLKQAKQLEMSSEQKIELCLQALSIASDFKDARDLLSTMPPSPPRNLQARVEGTTVILTWDGSPTPKVSYMIVRKSHSQPTSEKDGQLLGTVAKPMYEDRDLEIGIPVFYAVFAAFEGVVSSSGVLLQQPVLITQDVTNVAVRVDDCLVDLFWEVPSNIYNVIATRKEQIPPKSIDDGEPIDISNINRLVDRNVQNYYEYFYSIFCQFRNHSGQLVTSSGKTIRVVPEPSPQVIPYLEIMSTRITQGHEVHLALEQPNKGKGAILKSARLAPLKVNEVIPAAALSQYGQVLELHNGIVVDVLKDSGVFYYTPVIIFLDMAYIGATRRWLYMDSLSSLKSQALSIFPPFNQRRATNYGEVLITSFDYDGKPEQKEVKDSKHGLASIEYEYLEFHNAKGLEVLDHYIAVTISTQQND